jgi:phosphoserine phosphatase
MIYLVDICDTLYASNTTFDYVLFSLESQPLKKMLFHAMNSKWSPLFFLLVFLNKLLKKDFHKILSVGLLKNFSAKENEASTRLFYDSFLMKRKNEKVWTLLSQRNELDKVILVSSTIAPIAKVIAERNNFDYWASELELTKENRLSGRIINDLTGKKHLILNKIANKEKVTVITDNYTDLKLLRKADFKFIVLNHRKHRLRWKGIEANYIQLYE